MTAVTQERVLTRIYSDMGGVDFSSEPSLISPKSFAYLENMYRDYESGAGAGVETVPGYRFVTDYKDTIFAIHPHPESPGAMLVHAGDRLYRFDSEKRNFPPYNYPLLGPQSSSYTLAKRKSCSTLLDGRLYLADGDRIISVKEDILTPIERDAYVPTVYADGERYEQENLLTSEAVEEYHLFDPEHYRYYTERGVSFRLTPEGLCLITGYSGSDEVLVLPARVTLGAREYAVAGVASDAFLNNTTVRELIVSEGITMLEVRAFGFMKALKKVVFPSSLAEIPINCFVGCSELKTVYLPLGLERIGDYAFVNCRVEDVRYAGTAALLRELPGHTQLVPVVIPDWLTVTCGEVYKRVRCFLPLHSPSTAVSRVLLDERILGDSEEDILCRMVSGEDGAVLGVYLEAEEEGLIYGKTLSIRHTLASRFAEDMGLSQSFPYTAASVIGSCPLLTAFDGRLFVTGSPSLPGVVFFSGRRRDGTHDATYFGRFNHFRDGDGRRPI
ncbi:MAG: leucine-rich repeat domain-containing protein, partial [Clostridia bacterium]|nr:leucine-rich repeat domain-containing protein [Clostridia bacterium]